jgi:hypothetical protein
MFAARFRPVFEFTAGLSRIAVLVQLNACARPESGAQAFREQSGNLQLRHPELRDRATGTDLLALEVHADP